MEIGAHRHWQFQVDPLNWAKKRHTKPSQYFVTLDQQRPSKMYAWSPRPQSACSQVSPVLFYARTAKFVWAQIFVGNMRVSCLQAKCWQHHRSQNIGPAIAGSARPAYHKQLCAVCYVLDTSHRNAKYLDPQAPTCLQRLLRGQKRQHRHSASCLGNDAYLW